MPASGFSKWSEKDSVATAIGRDRYRPGPGEARDYLFTTRFDNELPGAALVEHLREAMRKEIAEEGGPPVDGPREEQIIHVSPISPVSNELWVYWENGQRLFYFSSDLDLADPAVWENETLMVRVIDLRRQVVVSAEEEPGSNDFLSRYQVGVTLFNCMVLGERLSLAQGAALSPPG